MEHDYDEYYDTKVSRPYARSSVGLIIGVALAFVGIADIVITIVDLYVSQYNRGQTETNTDNVYTWDENPFWPSYGKGFWVGLILLVAGILGIVSYCEHTLSSIYAFAALCTASAIFSFYLLITASIPLAKYNYEGLDSLSANGNRHYINSTALNAVLLSLGGLGFILASLGGILSCLLVGCCHERRGYGGNLVENYYRTIPANTPLRQGVVSAPVQQAVGVLNPSFF